MSLSLLPVAHVQATLLRTGWYTITLTMSFWTGQSSEHRILIRRCIRTIVYHASRIANRKNVFNLFFGECSIQDGRSTSLLAKAGEMLVHYDVLSDDA
ncbi:hypothetical protein BDR07DRAFT_1425843 [Suillus spraguei]|nr:hypothetical protein BDR07DRAFT_1425843 [Suillus spraguei]